MSNATKLKSIHEKTSQTLALIDLTNDGVLDVGSADHVYYTIIKFVNEISSQHIEDEDTVNSALRTSEALLAGIDGGDLVGWTDMVYTV